MLTDVRRNMLLSGEYAGFDSSFGDEMGKGRNRVYVTLIQSRFDFSHGRSDRAIRFEAAR